VTIATSEVAALWWDNWSDQLVNVASNCIGIKMSICST